MVRSFALLVLDTADSTRVLPHAAALELAKDRVRTAMRMRGRLRATA